VDVLFCNCAFSDVISGDLKQGILRELSDAGVNLVVVPDVCGISAGRDPLLADLAKRPALKIVACHPRAVRWLFHRGGAPLPESGITFYNMRAQSAEDILSSLALVRRSEDQTAPPGEAKAGSVARSSSGIQCDRNCANCVPAVSASDSRDKRAAIQSVEGKGDWIPWFPVIDYARCTKCRQCLEFCLFGVYEPAEEGGVNVANPSACKTNCPACARICPHAAIIFPKVEDDPINGAEIVDEEKVRANARINVEEYLGENVYAALAVRKMKRKALLLKKRENGVPV